MAIPYPLINGVRHSWSSVEIRVANQIVLGITEINYSPALDPAVVRGAGALPIGLTLGNMEYDGDFSILLEEFNALQTVLGDGMMTVPFDIVPAYDATLGNVQSGGLSVIVDSLLGCRITKIEAAASSGSTDALVRKCTIKYLDLLLNGLRVGPTLPTTGA
jgi:hypothetical protein